MYIYPVNCIENIDSVPSNKPILYSFIGTTKYQLNKPTMIREAIVNLDHSDSAVVEKISEWHFKDRVYGKQLNIVKSSENFETEELKREKHYRNVLSQSRFSLCPMGIGPNSIRLWESLSYGAIPIVISDNLWLPLIEKSKL